MNNKKQPTNQSENTLTEIFKYEVKEGVSEFHVMIHSTRPEDTYEEQLNAVANAYNDLLAGELKGAMAVFKRYFLSDTANQADLLLAITTELCSFRGRATPFGWDENSFVGLFTDQCADTSAAQRIV